MLLFLLGCHRPSSDDSVQDTAWHDDSGSAPSCVADYSDALGEGPDFSQPKGRFEITQSQWKGKYAEATFSGSLADAPAFDFHTESAREGNCRLLTYGPSTCTPACDIAMQACVDGACVPFPVRASAGPLTLSWQDSTTTIEPDKTTSYFSDLGPSVTGSVTLTGDGIDLATCAVVSPEPEGDWNALMGEHAMGEDATLRWSPTSADARVYLLIITSAQGHGGIGDAEIECEGPDSGELTIDGAFLDAIQSANQGCGECGQYQLVRYRAGGTSDLRLFATARSTRFGVLR